MTIDHVSADDRIRTSQAQVIARMQADPAACQRTYVTTGRIGVGLACQLEQGHTTAITDLGPAMGGDAAGPSPGFYARSAIAGCVGIAIKMLAVREGLCLDALTVTVETDFDDTAIMGLGSSRASPIRSRVIIGIVSTDDPECIAEVVDRALDRDPWFLALRDAQVVHPQLDLHTPAQSSSA
ncbi:OsmC family protein [Pseudooceanicola sp. LIPI14-2-Ac024]|uniref:OsmC family protein n=1 Tax=Pseudooceanicola sp. LIPI14-2-Ac024 TaxID=3344875 RepID=UPI0035D0CBCB